jgi:N6-adenosine-specific RNA methylase IME4
VLEEKTKRYSIIYADPPWEYRVWNKKDGRGTANSHYVTQSIKFLQMLDIDRICASDAVLLMWATFPNLPESINLGKAWGFVYKTIAFTWIKINPRNRKLFVGMGHYTRANAEVVLLFTKGKPLKRFNKCVQQVLIAKRMKHSEKPIEIRKRIEILFGDVQRIELFARDGDHRLFTDDHRGWDVFGNQVAGSIDIPLKLINAAVK